MLHVDIYSAYALCAAGSAIGAAMMLLARAQAPELNVRASLGTCALGFIVLAFGLFPMAIGLPEHLSDTTLLIAVEGTLIGSALFGIGIAQLNDRKTSVLVWLALVIAVALLGASQNFGTRIFGLALVVAGSAASLCIVVAHRRLLSAPQSAAELGMGAVLVLYCASWCARLVFTVAYDGPAQPHMLYVPDSVQPVFALYYGVVPIVISSLWLNVINARLRAALVEKAHTDELTGTMNRRALSDRRSAVLRTLTASGGTAAILMVDLDHFKVINDRHGHPAGDAVLRHTAAVIKANVRGNSFVTRFGGEEFMVLMRLDGGASAASVAERLRREIAETHCELDGNTSLTVTASIGVALLGAEDNFDETLKRADQALYVAKSQGRNRVHML